MRTPSLWVFNFLYNQKNKCFEFWWPFNLFFKALVLYLRNVHNYKFSSSVFQKFHMFRSVLNFELIFTHQERCEWKFPFFYMNIEYWYLLLNRVSFGLKFCVCLSKLTCPHMWVSVEGFLFCFTDLSLCQCHDILIMDWEWILLMLLIILQLHAFPSCFFFFFSCLGFLNSRGSLCTCTRKSKRRLFFFSFLSCHCMASIGQFVELW